MKEVNIFSKIKDAVVKYKTYVYIAAGVVGALIVWRYTKNKK